MPAICQAADCHRHSPSAAFDRPTHAVACEILFHRPHIEAALPIMQIVFDAAVHVLEVKLMAPLLAALGIEPKRRVNDPGPILRERDLGDVTAFGFALFFFRLPFDGGPPRLGEPMYQFAIRLGLDRRKIKGKPVRKL